MQWLPAKFVQSIGKQYTFKYHQPSQWSYIMLTYILDLWLVRITISTNHKPGIETVDPAPDYTIQTKSLVRMSILYHHIEPRLV